MAERYAATPRWRRSVTIAVVVVVAAAGLGWVAWAGYSEATPKVQSQLVTFHVGGEHSVNAQIDVRLSSGTTGASCTVQAVAEDHTIVGELHFRPADGTNRVTVRTDRAATSVELTGCIAKGQNRPR
jgi:hypothetical protein